MRNLILTALALSLGFSVGAFAEDTKSEGQSKLEIKDVDGRKNKVAGDIDEEIQNAKLRAESGSKSKFSGSMTANYKGGAISSAFAADRPNLAGTPGVQTSSSIQGVLNARYRANKSNSFTAGMTYAIMAPFNGSVRKTNFVDPTLGYNYVKKLGEFQTTGYLGYAYGTSNESKAINETHQFGASYNAMHAFNNGISAGASVGADYYNYTSAPGSVKEVASSKYGHDSRVAWDLGIFPQAEYKFNDRYSARTVFGYFNWKHLYGDANKYRMLQTFVYQSIGVGIAVTRDVFVYPNIQFTPNHITSNFTNVAVATTLNVF